MVEKRLLCPNRRRRTPAQFSWLDHRLMRERRLESRPVEAWALYLFLVTVGDAQGLSYYCDASLSTPSSSPSSASTTRRRATRRRRAIRPPLRARTTHRGRGQLATRPLHRTALPTRPIPREENPRFLPIGPGPRTSTASRSRTSSACASSTTPPTSCSSAASGSASPIWSQPSACKRASVATPCCSPAPLTPSTLSPPPRPPDSSNATCAATSDRDCSSSTNSAISPSTKPAPTCCSRSSANDMNAVPSQSPPIACSRHWPEIFNHDATLTSAVLDRLLHHAETVTVEGNSFRMKDVIDK